MDKDLLKKKLHEQIDAIDDELSLLKLLETAVGYRHAAQIHDESKSPNDSLQQTNDGEWISHDDLMELAKTWPKK